MAENWRAEREQDGELWCVKDDAGAIVFFGMDEGRARLFAAAPKLYEAAREAYTNGEWISGGWVISKEVCEMLQEAVYAAEPMTAHTHEDGR